MQKTDNKIFIHLYKIDNAREKKVWKHEKIL